MSDGAVYLDLRANTRAFESQANAAAARVKSAFGKAFGALATVGIGLGVKNFSAQCIEAAASAQQLSNRVATVFPEMQGKVDAFAATATEKMGMSAGAAKGMVAQFGMMAQGMGMTEQASAEMGAQMAQLAGDMAAFYGIGTDEAQAKLTGVFTGMTRGMKQLGVDMSEANLQAHALSLGIQADVRDLSQADLAALRLSYAQVQLAKTSGYAQRNLGTWTGQTALLQQQFGKLRATIGKGLVAALLPVVKVINAVLAGLVRLAEGFNALVEAVTGKSLADMMGGAAGVALDLSDAVDDSADSTAGLIEAQEDAARAAKAQDKAQKALNKTLAGFDKINRLSTEKAEQQAVASGGAAAMPSIDLGGLSGAAGALAAFNEEGAKLSKIKLPPALEKAFKSLKAAIDPFVQTVKNGLKWVYDNVLVPLGKWTMNELVPRLVKLLAAAFKVLNAAIEALKPFAKWIWENFLQPLAKWAGEKVCKVIDWLAKGFGKIAQWIKENPKAFTKIVAGLLALFGARKGFKAFKGILGWLMGKKTGLGGLARMLKNVPGGKGLAKKVSAMRKALKGLTAGKLFASIGKKLKGLGGGFKGLGSRIKSAGGRVAGGVSRMVKGFGRFLRVKVGPKAKAVGSSFRTLGSRLAAAGRRGAKGVGRLVTSFGRFAKTKVSGVAKSVGKAFKTLGSRIAGVGGKLAKSKIGNVIGKLGKSLGKVKGPLRVVLQLITKNPIGIAVTAVAAGLLAIYKNWDKIKQTKVGQSLQNIADKFAPVAEKASELGEKILGKVAEMVGKVIEAAGPLLEKILPAVEDVAGFIADGLCAGLDALGKIIDAVGPTIEAIAKTIGDVLGGAIEGAAGVLDALNQGWRWLTGQSDDSAEKTVDVKEKKAGTLDSTKKKWDGISDRSATLTASANDKASKGIDALKPKWGSISDKSATLIASTSSSIDKNWNSAKGAFDWSKTGLANKTATITGNAKGALDKAWDNVKSAFTWANGKDSTFAAKSKTLTGTAKGTIEGAWSKVKSAFGWANKKNTAFVAKAKTLAGTVKGNIVDTWSKIRGAFGWANEKGSAFVAKAKTMTGTVKGTFASKWADIKSAFNWANKDNSTFATKSRTLTGSLKENSASIFSSMKNHWNWAKDNLYDVAATASISFNDGFSDAYKTTWNSMADAANGVFSKIKSSFGLGSSLYIPKLYAQGGWVARNTPQLAVIGDNTREGEIVSPESKLQAMADRAAANGGNAAELLPVLTQILAAIQAQDRGVYLDGREITRSVVRNVNNQTHATGRCAIVV